MSKTKSQSEIEPTTVEVAASEPSKMVPKLATRVTLSKAESGGNIALTFISFLPGEQAQVIERIVLDTLTAKQLADLLYKNIDETISGGE